MEDTVDVCVVGGGPAGAAVAQRLGRLGHSVCVIERASFPRPHVGESLPSSILPILDAAGVREDVESAGFLRPRGALVRWRGATEDVHEPSGEPGFQVDRARFDALLLDAARRAGARVLEGARAGRPVESGFGFLVPVTTPMGRRTISARFVVDATGKRSGFLPAAKRVGAPTVALYAYFRDAEIRGPETRVEAGANGWYWGAPLPDATLNVTVFLDALSCASVGKEGREALYARLLSESSLLRGCLRGSRMTPVLACDASFSADEHPVGKALVRVGEAAFAIDPLASQGVQAAITSGLAGAVVAHTLLTHPERRDLAVAFYERRQREVVGRHRRLAAGHYSERASFAPSPFWSARATDAFEAHTKVAPLRSTAPRDGCRLVLAQGAKLVRAPILDGDLITHGEALDHPALPRPVTFVGSVAVPPLLRLLEGPDDATAIVRRWCRSVPPSAGWALVDWLWQRRLLVADGRA